MKEPLNKIYRIRKDKGLTLRELSEITKVGHVTLEKIECGESDPKQSTIIKISRGLKMKAQDVFNLD
jgi:transcriptional regulator with XRE-family HTH domain